MTCKPLNVTPDQFDNSAMKAWSTAPTTTIGGKTVTRTTTTGYAGIKVTGPTGSVFHTTVGEKVSKYMFFGSDNYLLILDQTTSPGSVTYTVTLIDFTQAPPKEKSLFSVLTPSGKDPPKVQFSQGNGSVFLIYAIDTSGQFANIGIYRSDNGTLICEVPPRAPASTTVQLVGKATATELLILDNGNVLPPTPYPLPSGKCLVLDQDKVITKADFHEVVWDGPAEKTKKLSLSIKNGGNDCLHIKSANVSAPFRLISPTAFPVFVGSGAKIPFVLEFSPQGLGSFDEVLTIDATDPASDMQIHCIGKARKSLAECEVTGSGQVLQVVFGVNNSALGTYGIRNMGEDLLKVESIRNSPHFTVVPPIPDYSSLLSHNQQLSVSVEFAPSAVTGSTPITEDLQVTSTPPNGASKISCKGSARLPIVGLNAVQPASFTTYLFRRKRIPIILTNTGEVLLTIDVTSTSMMFKFTPIDIPANSSKSLDVDVWSDKMGNFSVPLTIHGTNHLVVDKNGQSIIDRDLQTSCAVVVSGEVIPMPPDQFDAVNSNGDFTTATEVDLPLPHIWDPVQRGFLNLNLDDRNRGQDKDYFTVSYKSSPQDDNSTGGSIVRHTLGMVMQSYPPSLDIQTSTRPETRDDRELFSRMLQIFSSDAYNRNLFATTNGSIHIECPTLTFNDKKLYVMMSNPAYSSQGPVEYDILFRYTPFKAILRCGAGLTKAEFVKLKRYYDAIWHVDPPSDLAGNRVDADAWMHGAVIVIGDIKSFLNKHREFMSRPDILKGLQKTMNKPSNAILASEWLSLAQVARAGGLLGEAEKLYQESAAMSSQARQSDTQAEALRGLLGLYVAEAQSAKVKRVEKSLIALLKKSQRG